MIDNKYNFKFILKSIVTNYYFKFKFKIIICNYNFKDLKKNKIIIMIMILWHGYLKNICHMDSNHDLRKLHKHPLLFYVFCYQTNSEYSHKAIVTHSNAVLAIHMYRHVGLKIKYEKKKEKLCKHGALWNKRRKENSKMII